MSKSSIEEQVEDIAKKQLSEIKYYTKTEVINSEIEKALKIAPSKVVALVRISRILNYL